MVGGSAAALLFHTLGIYIFTTASEWPGAAMTSSISFGAVVQVALKNKAEALANKRSEGLMCCWTTSAGGGGARGCRTRCSKGDSNCRNSPETLTRSDDTTPGCLSGAKRRRGAWEIRKCGRAVWRSRCQPSRATVCIQRRAYSKCS